MKLLRLASLSLFFVLIAVSPRPVTAQSKLQVVTSFSILGDFVANIGGDAIEQRVLVGADGDTHTFEPTPGDARALAAATVIFENGLGFESWLDRLYRASGSRATRVAVTNGITPLSADPAGHRHGEYDPHMWHDPTRVIQMVYTIRDALTAADPANAWTYGINAAVYASFLSDLDSWVSWQVWSIPEHRRALITAHNSFGYLASRYGFAMAGAAISSFSTESQPSAAELAALVREVRTHQVPAVFPENVSSARLIERVARDAGVRLAPPLCSDALSRPSGPCSTYFELMYYNVGTIVASLS